MDQVANPFKASLSHPSSSYRLLSAGRDFPVLYPVQHLRTPPGEGLLGLSGPIQILRKNLASFEKGLSPVSTLIHGFRGTGKTSMVLQVWRQMDNHHKTIGISPCRLIQVDREGIPHLLPLIEALDTRPEFALILFDDLYFPPEDPLFHHFRSFLDGGIAGLPENVGLVVTSNHRHMISESFSKRDDALHPRETVDDSLALWDRFGLTLSFTEPNPEQYLDLVLAKLASRKLLPKGAEPPNPLPEEPPLGNSHEFSPPDTLSGIIQRATLFSRLRASRSGRTAEWFADLYERGLIDIIAGERNNGAGGE
ncbi:MAG: DUF815 domain-containing protein [Leptospirales bacterium]